MLASSALVAGVLLAPSGNAAANATGPNLDRYCVPPAESDTSPQASSSCRAIIVSQAKTGSNNTWRIDRTFSKSGRFYFVARTSENINNGRGHSNQRLTVIN